MKTVLVSLIALCFFASNAQAQPTFSQMFNKKWTYIGESNTSKTKFYIELKSIKARGNEKFYWAMHKTDKSLSSKFIPEYQFGLNYINCKTKKIGFLALLFYYENELLFSKDVSYLERPEELYDIIPLPDFPTVYIFEYKYLCTPKSSGF